jgi:hypothetical protein
MSYRFRCPDHGDIDHDDREPPVCFCGELMVRVYVMPYVSAAATPTSRSDTNLFLERDRQWARDMPAYKRMRANGVQPKGIDGSARLEAGAETQTELAMGKVLPVRKVREAAERSSEVLGHDVGV